MPSLGADMESGTLLEWLVQPGTVVHRGDPFVVVDTDKAAIEVESFSDGVVDELLVEPGTRVPVGATMARFVSEAQAAEAPAAPPEHPVQHPVPHPADHPVQHPAATPPVRHHAAELGVDLATVAGTGPHGTVRRQDVDAAAAATRAEAPVTPTRAGAPAAAASPAGRVPASPYARSLAAKLGIDLDDVRTGDGPVHAGHVLAYRTAHQAAPAPAREHRPARGAIASLMARSKREVPHYYVASTVDLGPATSWLRRTNRDRPISERIVPAALILRATALAARQVPELIGFWVDDAFVAGEDVHLGVAVSVRGGGLVAPALRHAADLPVPELMGALRDLVARARAGRLTRAEMADPTLTVTDLGDQGVEEVIGVIYPPQVALVGVGRIVERPWAVDGMLTVRPVVRLTLSGDHRATDGVTGARFLSIVDRLLQQPEEL